MLSSQTLRNAGTIRFKKARSAAENPRGEAVRMDTALDPSRLPERYGWFHRPADVPGRHHYASRQRFQRCRCNARLPVCRLITRRTHAPTSRIQITVPAVDKHSLPRQVPASRRATDKFERSIRKCAGPGRSTGKPAALNRRPRPEGKTGFWRDHIRHPESHSPMSKTRVFGPLSYHVAFGPRRVWSVAMFHPSSSEAGRKAQAWELSAYCVLDECVVGQPKETGNRQTWCTSVPLSEVGDLHLAFDPHLMRSDQRLHWSPWYSGSFGFR